VTESESDPVDLRGRVAHLRPACEDDRELARTLTSDPVVARQWRYQPRTPSRQDAYDIMIGATDAAFVVCSNRGDRDVGIVNFLGLNLADRRVFYAVAHLPEVRNAGWPMEGTGLAINWAFRTWPVNKVQGVVERATHAGKAARGAGRLFEVEAEVPSMVYSDGTWDDLLLVATTREHWQAWKDGVGRPGDP